MIKVLLVEDDPQISKFVAEALSKDNYLVESVDSGEDALQLLTNFKYELILLDWNLTGITGLTVCQRFRATGGKTPIIFMTGEGDIDHKESGFDSGADDYLVKPFEVRELTARIRSILRRPSELLSSELKVGDVVLDTSTRTVYVRKEFAHLTPKECSLLEYLMRHPNHCFSAKAMLDAVWPSQSETNEDTVRTIIKTLRQKLIKLGQADLVKTVPHAGYKIELPS